MAREIRIRHLPDRFDGKTWHTKPQRVFWLGSVGNWAVVRNADFPSAVPFCISIKEWKKLEADRAVAGGSQREPPHDAAPRQPV